MPPKTERFELRMDEDVLARIDDWRGEQEDLPTRSEAVRRLVELGLSRTGGDRVKFSDGEKLLTIMLRDIYKHLGMKSGEIDPDFVSEAICGGHSWALKWKMHGLYHDYEDEPTEVRFVVNVLDMWSFVEIGYRNLDQDDRDRIEREVGPLGKHVAFRGFDGNNEASYMGIALFFVEKMGRFGEFKGRDMNSHVPMVGAYRAMLRAFEPMRKTLIGANLGADQIIAILQARNATSE
ncbi:YfbU family protein [Cupriavidus sp. DF5525]|uniref:YfbU family protein n=1 Tax=Cupriavidus sp. DF5525 TaxID=3160989 RepID=UPI0032DEEDEC